MTCLAGSELVAFDYDGVPVDSEALDGLQVPHCAASSGSHAKMRRTLGQTGFRHHRVP